MRRKFLLSLLLSLLFIESGLLACTNLLVTPGASKDGSAFLYYSNDGEWLYQLTKQEAKDHPAGEWVSFTNRDGVSGKIPQVSHTYAVVGFQMNEHQLAIGETTFVGREEIWDHSSFLEYWQLMGLALERARTAREAIQVITSLVEQYGYGSEGESFSIVDKKEAWILEMIGSGPGSKGAIWVAQRVPDGFVSAHANMSRIGEFPLNDPENCLYSKNVITFAIEKGFYNPKAGKPFRFNEIYNPPSPDRLKYCETRVWSLFRRISPSLNLSPDYHRGVPGAERYPLCIRPDVKLSITDIFNLVRDHYEGTSYDMTTGVDAGPFGSPFRVRPLLWNSENEPCSWERPISSPNSAFSFIAQIRPSLPDPLGGILWFGVDDSYFTVYVPVYVGVDSIPAPLATGDLNKFSWKSMFWVFNFVSNFANLRYDSMIVDIQKVQKALESEMIADQDSINQSYLSAKNGGEMKVLTNYSITACNHVHSKWIELGESLITKYNDGYIKDEKGVINEKGYDQQWLDMIKKTNPNRYKLTEWDVEYRNSMVPH